MFDRNHEFTGIDFTKLVCAFLVVAIHTDPFPKTFLMDYKSGLLLRIPVPFYFMASGFLFSVNIGKQESEKSSYLMKYLKRIFVLYGIWTLIYAPVLIPQMAGASGIGENVKLILQKLCLTGVNGHLWYFPALLLAVVLFYINDKALGKRRTLIISCILYIVGTIMNTYKTLIPSSFLFRGGIAILNCIGTRNGIFYGFLYVTMGALLYEKGREDKIVGKREYILFLLAVAILAVENYYTTYILKSESNVLLLSCPFVMYEFFRLIAFWDISLPNHAAVAFRNISTLIFTSRFIWIYFLVFVIKAERNGMAMFCLSSIGSLFFSAAVILISRKFKMLKVLY